MTDTVRSKCASAPLAWQSKLAKQLLATGLPQATMVVGRLGDGLTQLCEYLAAKELTHNNPVGQKLFYANSHPDLQLLTRTVSSTGKLRQNIVIEQVREFMETAHLTPMQGLHRYAVIVPACRLNHHAANAMLKLLEEPPDTLKLLLGVERPDWLPATIRSRCQLYMAPSPDEQQALTWLDEQGLDDSRQALALANGAPLDAIACAQHLDAHSQLKQLCTGKKILSGPQAKLEALEPSVWLQWTLNWAEDGARLACGLSPRHPGEASVAKHINKQWQPNPLAWLDLHQHLSAAYAIVTRPIVNRLMLEYVTFHFCSLARR